MRINSGCFRLLITFAAASAAIALGQEVPSQPPPVEGQPQDQPAPASEQHGWRRVTEPPATTAQRTIPPGDPAYPAPAAPADASTPPPPPQKPAPNNNIGYQPADAYGQTQPAYPPQGGTAYPPPNSGYQPLPQIPAVLTVKPGTYLTIRVDQPLSSDHNHAGDGFSATLVKPLVVDGVVVAQTGQTVGGRITEAQKAGRIEGTSRLAVELIDMTLVDGSQLPLKTQLVNYTGPTSIGRDVAAVGGTTALGAIVGGAAYGGAAAGIGAGAGALVGLIGVLTTRGHQTIIYPESVLTFRIEQPLTITTTRAPQAFHFAQPADYQQSARLQQRYGAAPQPRRSPVFAFGYPYPYPYWYGYNPYFWGPSVGLFWGGGWGGWGGGGYGGRGFYGHR